MRPSVHRAPRGRGSPRRMDRPAPRGGRDRRRGRARPSTRHADAVGARDAGRPTPELRARPTDARAGLPRRRDRPRHRQPARRDPRLRLVARRRRARPGGPADRRQPAARTRPTAPTGWCRRCWSSRAPARRSARPIALEPGSAACSSSPPTPWPASRSSSTCRPTCPRPPATRPRCASRWRRRSWRRSRPSAGPMPAVGCAIGASVVGRGSRAPAPPGTVRLAFATDRWRSMRRSSSRCSGGGGADASDAGRRTVDARARTPPRRRRASARASSCATTRLPCARCSAGSSSGPAARPSRRPAARRRSLLVETSVVDAIVSDHRMPGMSGIDLYARATAVRPDLADAVRAAVRRSRRPGDRGLHRRHGRAGPRQAVRPRLDRGGRPPRGPARSRRPDAAARR